MPARVRSQTINVVSSSSVSSSSLMAASPLLLLRAAPCPTVGAQRLVGRGVAAGLGGEVTAEAEHVGPAAQAAPGVAPVLPLLLGRPVLGAGAELVGERDQAAEMGVGVAVLLGRFGGHAPGDGQPGGFGRLRGVLRQVAGDRLGGDLRLPRSPRGRMSSCRPQWMSHEWLVSA